jgi:hypothetical protein
MTEKCLLDSRWKACCCNCASHFRLSAHPHFPDYPSGHVCAPAEFMQEGWVSVIGEHGICELWLKQKQRIVNETERQSRQNP